MTPVPEGDQDNHPDPSLSEETGSGFMADGVALGASAILTALIGLLGWLLAARILEPAEVGRASAFVNGFVFVAGVAELGMGQACLKWLPAAGGHTRAMLTRVYSGVLTSAVVIAVVWGLVTRGELTEQTGLGTLGAVALFVVAAVAWTLFHVHSFTLTSLGAARWVPLEMITFGILRVVLLVVLAQAYGALGVIVSWMLPTLLMVLVIVAVLVLRRHRRDGLPGALPTRRAAVRMAGSIYVSTFGITLTVSLVPVLVTARFGPATGAVFFIIWNGVAAVELAAAGFASALVVRLTGDSLTLLGRAVRQVVPLFAAPLVLAALASGPLLSLFGRSYAEEGTGLLRWVCAGLLVRLVGVLIVGIHLVQERTVRLVLVNAGPAVALILAIVLLPTTPSLGVLGAVYLAIQVVVVVTAVVDLRAAALRERGALVA